MTLEIVLYLLALFHRPRIKYLVQGLEKSILACGVGLCQGILVMKAIIAGTWVLYEIPSANTLCAIDTLHIP